MGIEVIKPAIWCPGFRADHPLATGIVELWPAWTGAGDRAMGVSPNGNRGTLTNGPTWVHGPRGWAWALDGANQYLAAATKRMSASAGTIAIRLMTTTTALGQDYVFGHYNGGNRIYMYRDGKNFNTRVGSTAAQDSGWDFTADEWVTIGLTWDGTDAASWVDGVQQASAGYAGLSALAATIAIGDNTPGGGVPWTGQIDLAAIWARNLGTAEMEEFTLDPHALITPPSDIVVFAGGMFGGGVPPTGNRRRRVLIGAAA